MSLSEDIRKLLEKENVAYVGFADISGISPKSGLNSGIVFYIPYEKETIKSIRKAPTEDYLAEYLELNRKLDEIAIKCEEFLIDKGYKAYAQTTTRVGEDAEDDSFLPHKTIATRAGLGWIGKSALFVTNDYGSAIRLSSVLTNAKLDFGTPINSSLCRMCTICRNECPAGAISGIEWNSKMSREDFFDYKKCEKKASKISKKKLKSDITLCGKCIYVCPHTQKYIR
ncbi:MAG: 4Fe-4S double cluster binding domain-containing protein [Methanobacteriaceae archaeon]|nr:4Fe-4S double cluster binding domain-containing protein [Methanobacteriaceae archaeon]